MESHVPKIVIAVRREKVSVSVGRTSESSETSEMHGMVTVTCTSVTSATRLDCGMAVEFESRNVWCLPDFENKNGPPDSA